MRQVFSALTRSQLSVSALMVAAGTQIASGGLPPGSVQLSGFASVDNAFEASISASPTEAGTIWMSGNNWQSISSGATLINSPGIYYLHVRAQDFGRPEMFIGRFNLAGIGATFANGTQEVVTNITDWVVSTSGFGIDTTAPLYIGDNGAGPWGNFAATGANADFIWAPQYANGIAYFTTSFTIVPAPAAVATLSLGGLLVARRRRR